MVKKPTITALITGRGNNTLRDKNVLPVFGRPILQYPGLAVKKIPEIEHFYISSDDDKILKAGNDIGFQSIRRPDELGRPDTKHIDVIDHALEVLKEKGIHTDILIVLLANTVTVKTEWIRECIDELRRNPSLTACVPVYKEMDHHPYRAKKLDENGLLTEFFDFTGREVSTNRQELVPCYFLSHNFWVLNLNTIDREKGHQPWKFLGEHVKPLVVDEAFDIHIEEDLMRCERWLKEHGIV